MTDAPIPALARLRDNRFLVIGRAGIDLSPDPPGSRTEAALRFTACLGGSGANIAVALARLGATAELLSCVADDAVGRFVLNELDRYGVGRGHVARVGDAARTSLALTETRSDDPQSVLYRNGAADFQLGIDAVAAVDFARYGALVISGTALAAEPSRGAVFRALEQARGAGLSLVFDIDHRRDGWASAAETSEVCARAASLSDMVVGSEDEFALLGPGDGLAEARALARDGTRIVVYKMGATGAVTLAPSREIRTGIYPVRALKPTGAGDGFLGGLLASLAAGFDLREAVLRGSACAAIVVSRVGCAPAVPSIAELDRFLATHPGPRPDPQEAGHAQRPA